MVKHQILRLDVAMDNFLAMHCFQCMDDARAEKLSLFHRESFLLGQVEAEVAAKQQVHDQIEVFGILKGVVGVDYELGVDHAEELEFVHDRRDAFLVHDSGLEHLLHGELGVVLALDAGGRDPPDFAEPSSSDGVLVFEESFVEC